MIIPIVAIPSIPVAIVTIATLRLAAAMMVVVPAARVSVPLVISPESSSLERQVLRLENRSPVQRNNCARHAVVDQTRSVYLPDGLAILKVFVTGTGRPLPRTYVCGPKTSASAPTVIRMPRAAGFSSPTAASPSAVAEFRQRSQEFLESIWSRSLFCLVLRVAGGRIEIDQRPLGPVRK